MVRTVSTNRVFFMVAGVVVAVLIAWQINCADKVVGNPLAIQKINTNKILPLISFPGILSWSRKIVKAIKSLERR